MPKFKSNLGIFYTNEYLENNVPNMGNTYLDDVKVDDIDAWEILGETFDENGLVEYGVYIAYDPFVDLALIKNKSNFVAIDGLDLEAKLDSYIDENNIPIVIPKEVLND
jgi:hypothetical protein